MYEASDDGEWVGEPRVTGLECVGTIDRTRIGDLKRTGVPENETRIDTCGVGSQAPEKARRGLRASRRQTPAPLSLSRQKLSLESSAIPKEPTTPPAVGALFLSQNEGRSGRETTPAARLVAENGALLDARRPRDRIRTSLTLSLSLSLESCFCSARAATDARDAS